VTVLSAAEAAQAYADAAAALDIHAAACADCGSRDGRTTCCTDGMDLVRAAAAALLARDAAPAVPGAHAPDEPGKPTGQDAAARVRPGPGGYTHPDPAGTCPCPTPGRHRHYTTAVACELHSMTTQWRHHA
jgi:hypothetical protein